MVKPYKDKYLSEGVFLREFLDITEIDDLVWHRDRKNRTVTVLEGEGWKIQFDNKLPQKLIRGKLYDIKEGVYHRLIKDDTATKLKLKIWEEQNA